MKKHLSILIITLAFIFMAGAVQAAMVTETFSGMITYAADGQSLRGCNGRYRHLDDNLRYLLSGIGRLPGHRRQRKTWRFR